MRIFAKKSKIAEMDNPPPPDPQKKVPMILSADQAREILQSEKALAAKAEMNNFLVEMEERAFMEIMEGIAIVAERGLRWYSLTWINESEIKPNIVKRLKDLGYVFEPTSVTSGGQTTKYEEGGFSW